MDEVSVVYYDEQRNEILTGHRNGAICIWNWPISTIIQINCISHYYSNSNKIIFSLKAYSLIYKIKLNYYLSFRGYSPNFTLQGWCFFVKFSFDSFSSIDDLFAISLRRPIRVQFSHATNQAGLRYRVLCLHTHSPNHHLAHSVNFVAAVHQKASHH